MFKIFLIKKVKKIYFSKKLLNVIEEMIKSMIIFWKCLKMKREKQ